MRSRFARACIGGTGLTLGALVQATSAVPGVGCATHACDQTCLAFYGAPIPSSPPGSAPSCSPSSAPGPDDAYLDGNTVVWESSPFDGEWLPFVGGTWVLVNWKKTVEAVVKGTPYEGWAVAPSEIDPYVATTEDAATSRILVPTGDQLTEMQNVGPDGVWINNASCADYFLRVVARLHLVAPDAAAK